MIPKAQILDLAKAQQLRPTTVEKDYVIGWMLRAVSQHPTLSHWVFKGGTCLKKCFFETYRFSEDLDFTVATADTLRVCRNQQAYRSSGTPGSPDAPLVRPPAPVTASPPGCTCLGDPALVRRL